MFALFGLLPDDEYVPEGLLAAAWGYDAAELRGLLKCLQDSGLVKWEPQAERAVLHDLSHDFASAMAATQRGGLVKGHADLVDKCGALAAAEGAAGEWWRGVELHHLRSAGRGREGSERVWRLDWLMRGVRERGASAVTREVFVQLAWEKTQGGGAHCKRLQ
jgi:hypothetical protein